MFDWSFGGIVITVAVTKRMLLTPSKAEPICEALASMDLIPSLGTATPEGSELASSTPCKHVDTSFPSCARCSISRLGSGLPGALSTPVIRCSQKV